MKVTFFNSSTVKVPSFLVTRKHSGALTLKVRFAVVEHETEGVILIDGGYGKELYSPQASPALKMYRSILRPTILISPKEALEKLGRKPDDVTHVVVSHLHADHVCGLGGFPNAKYWMPAECRRICHKSSALTRIHNGIFRELLCDELLSADSLQPDDAGQYDLLGDGTICPIPLPGHAAGHFGFLFPTVGNGLLYAVDTAWTEEPVQSVSAARFPASLIIHNRTAERSSLMEVRNHWKAGRDFLLCHNPGVHELDWREP